MDSRSQIEHVKELMKKHDWFFEKSDCTRAWNVGLAERTVILALIAEFSEKALEELLGLVPIELRDEWLFDLHEIRGRRSC